MRKIFDKEGFFIKTLCFYIFLIALFALAIQDYLLVTSCEQMNNIVFGVLLIALVIPSHILFAFAIYFVANGME